MSSNKKKETFDNAEFDTEDLDALLQFPYHKYKVKKEVFEDLPELGLIGNLVLNNDFTLDSCDSASTALENTTSTPFDARSLTHSSASFACSSTAVSVKYEPKTCIPKSTTKIEKIQDGISLNLSLQQKIVACLTKLRHSLNRNRVLKGECNQKLREKEEVEKSNSVQLKHTKPISLFAAPYFRDQRGMCCPDNEDTIAKKRNKEVNAYLQPPRAWTKDDKDKLMAGVSATALAVALKPIKVKRDYLKNKLKDQNITDEELELVKEQILDLEDKIKEESKRPLKELLEESNGEIDWMTIAASSMEASRTEEECEIMWNNYLSISVNKNKFTAGEDERLRMLAEKVFNGKNWDAVAEKLQTNRSAIQCFERFQNHLNKNFLKKYWTPDEDQKLMKTIDLVRVGKYIPWNKVSMYMPGRARHQIINRYERTISKGIRREKWSVEEDAMLIGCYKKFGAQWCKMKEFLPGRTAYGCRERYINTLDPTLRIGDWSKAEDMHLIKLIRRYGYGKWAQISREMPGRTDNMCLVRTTRLRIHSISFMRDAEDLDRVKLAQMLKPRAPTKMCLEANTKLRNLQAAAFQSLKDALRKIQMLDEDEVDFDNLDLTTMSTNTLRDLYKELCRVEDQNDKTPWTPKYMFVKGLKQKNVKPRPQRSCTRPIQPDSSDDDNIDDPDASSSSEGEWGEEEPVFSSREKMHIRNVLDSKFAEAAKLLPTRMRNKRVALTSRETMEYAVYKQYMYQNFYCQKLYDEDDIECPNPEYMEELSLAVKYFVQPPVVDDLIMVACPNFATLQCFEVMQNTRAGLRKMSRFVEHSSAYTRYLSEGMSERPKCVKCSGGGKGLAIQKKYEDVLNEMKLELIVPNETLQQAMAIETCYSEEEECVCQKLEESKESLNLLMRRFIGLFLWPSLLSNVKMSDEQGLLLKNIQPGQRFNYGAREQVPDTKRKQPKNAPPSKRLCVSGDQSGGESALKIKCEESSDQTTDQPPKKKGKERRQRYYRDPNLQPVRRSSRACVLTRKNFACVVKDEG